MPSGGGVGGMATVPFTETQNSHFLACRGMEGRMANSSDYVSRVSDQFSSPTRGSV